MRMLKFFHGVFLIFPLISFFSYGSITSKTAAYVCHNCSNADFISLVKKEALSNNCKFTTSKGETSQDEKGCYNQNEKMIVVNPTSKIASKFIVQSTGKLGGSEIKSLPLTQGEKNDLDIFYQIDNSFIQLSSKSIVTYAGEYDNSNLNKKTPSAKFDQKFDYNKNAQCSMSSFPTDFFTSKDYKQRVLNELGALMKASLKDLTWTQFVGDFKDKDLTGLNLELTDVDIIFNHSNARKIFVHVIYDKNDYRVAPDNRLTFSVSYVGEYYREGNKNISFIFELEPDLSYAGGVSISDLFTPSGSDNSVRFYGDKVDPCLVQFFELNKTQATTQTPLSNDEIYGHWAGVLDEGGGKICRLRTPIRGYSGYGCFTDKNEVQDLTYEYMGLCN